MILIDTVRYIDLHTEHPQSYFMICKCKVGGRGRKEKEWMEEFDIIPTPPFLSGKILLPPPPLL